MSTPEPVGVSTVGRQLGRRAAKVAMHPDAFNRTSSSPDLSRITEGSHESVSIVGGAIEDPTTEKIRGIVSRTISNKFAVAGLVFMITAILLIVINPPMAQTLAGNTATPHERSVQKILVWSSLAGVIALILPYCIQLVRKSN
jgi:hypothetical protein